MSMGLAVTGILLMGVDLLLTRSFFVHAGELMIASLFCFVLALVVDPRKTPSGKDRA